MKRFGLLPKILIAIALGIICGIWLPTGAVRIFSTFNSIFGEFLSFIIPLIILGLVAPAIADIGKDAGRLLIQTVILAYGFTLLAGILSYGVSVTSFPSFIDTRVDFEVQSKAVTPEPFFTISMPPLMTVMTALILAFTLGLGMAYINGTRLQEVCQEGYNNQDHRVCHHSTATYLYFWNFPKHDSYRGSLSSAESLCWHYWHYFPAPHFLAFTSVFHCRGYCTKEPITSIEEHVACLFHGIGYTK